MFIQAVMHTHTHTHTRTHMNNYYTDADTHSLLERVLSEVFPLHGSAPPSSPFPPPTPHTVQLYAVQEDLSVDGPD